MFDNNMKLLFAVSSFTKTEAASKESLSILSNIWLVLERKFSDTPLITSNSASSFERFHEEELVRSFDSEAEVISSI